MSYSTFNKESNQSFRTLIEFFKLRTGVPMILNTSSNVNSPIAETANEVIELLAKVDVSYFYEQGTVIAKKIKVLEAFS